MGSPALQFTKASRPQLARRAAAATREFRTEAEFVTALHRILLTLGGADVSTEREVAAGRRIADLVLLTHASASSEQGLREHLSVADCVLLATLRRRGALSREALAAATSSSEQSVLVSVQRLSRAGLVSESRTGRVSIVKPRTRAASLIAFEAKLDRWRDALAQAAWYRRYADTSYVVLPLDRAAPAIAAEAAFRAVGVGLLVFDAATLYCAIPAARSREHDWRREFVLSRMTANHPSDAKR